MTPDRLPGWPRRLKAPLAAAYLSLSESKFLHGVEHGRYPEPHRDGGNIFWDRMALDRYVDSFTTPANDDGEDPLEAALDAEEEARRR